jgi:RNA polymerase sigma factor (sigma-70 family)
MQAALSEAFDFHATEGQVISSDSASTRESLNRVLLACVRRVRSWRVPPNWSTTDWFQEIEEVQAVAGWLAECDFDSSKGIPLAGFVYHRVMAHALCRYRQEWTYARRFVPEIEQEEEDSKSDDHSRRGATTERAALSEDDAELREAVESLAGSKQWLVEQIYWHGHTESEIGSVLGISQRAVNKRKQTVLRLLCKLLGEVRGQGSGRRFYADHRDLGTKLKNMTCEPPLL